MGISFVVPAFNEAANIANVLRRIIKFSAGQLDYEIIAIDNFSSDKTIDELNRFNGVDIIKLTQKHTVAYVRNLGWRRARYDTVAFIDGDVLLTEEWVSEMVRLQSVSFPDNFIFGATYSLSESPGWIETSWFSLMRNVNRKYINGGNLITVKSVLTRLHGFNDQLISGEDVDFCRRAELLEIKISHNSKLKVFHEGYPKNCKSFFLREIWHGVGDVQTFSGFFRSRTAVLAFSLFVLLFASFILALMHLYLTAICFASLFFLLNLLLIFLKFNISNVSSASKIFLLMLIYNFARVFSIMRRSRI
jgi:glycosyltransferase involved in cell wall biosynthesis